VKFVKPKPAEVFTITSTPEWPVMEFLTDGKGSHVWAWSLAWGTFKASGTATTPENRWDAKAVVMNLGGMLTVTAQAGQDKATVSVNVRGTNPTAIEATQYLAMQQNSAGFEKILEHESKFKQFKPNGEPVKSFDNGFGMCQLTTPAPTFAQVWNWKMNIDAGLKLFEQKRVTAVNYLSQSKRTYTPEQLKYETVCRWNGGKYHEWDATAGAWVRMPNVLCDTQTGNIGWDMTKPENKDKTEAELRARDKGAYSAGPKQGANWRYYGVCYAERILG
jgi:hypothetical protein